MGCHGSASHADHRNLRIQALSETHWPGFKSRIWAKQPGSSAQNPRRVGKRAELAHRHRAAPEQSYRLELVVGSGT